MTSPLNQQGLQENQLAGLVRDGEIIGVASAIGLVTTDMLEAIQFVIDYARDHGMEDLQTAAEVEASEFAVSHIFDVYHNAPAA